MPAIATERFLVVPGLAMPFAPARPRCTLHKLDKASFLAQYEQDIADLSVVIQPKLNGDRAGIGRCADGVLRVQNRHLGWTTQAVRNLAAFRRLNPGTFLDGEIEGGNFYPFECVALDGDSLVRSTTRCRVAAAKRLCEVLGIPYIFDAPTRKFAAAHVKNLPRWEGYVRKVDAASYSIGHSAAAETTDWCRVKWTLR